MELALWFHDLIYDPRAKDNEERSAERAGEVAQMMKLSQTRVRDLILATKHSVVPIGRDAQLVVDMDLSILGAPAVRFGEYETQIREEYAWVPEPIFRTERGRILRSFLARPAIYSTEEFRSRLEGRARENLERSLRLHR